MVMAAMRETFAATASDLFERDERVAIVLADISETLLRQAIHHDPTRAINVGIAEQTMVGVAAGFAMEGFHPIAHSLSPFMAERPYEQLKLDFGDQGLGGTFVGAGGSYDYAGEGGTHHSPADASVMLAIPGMQVLVPGHASEVDQLLRAVYANGLPTYLRTSLAANDEAHDVSAGRLEVVHRGAGATVLAFGPMLSRALEATAHLDATVVYATSLEPFDAEGLREIAGASPDLVVVEPWYEGTAGPVIAAAFADRAARVRFIGVPRKFIHRYGTMHELDEALGMDPAGIRARL
jgi:transketolase